jgi:alkanesulfonate monooxygenase SsuD/methylene tetrahydromethanopterin reductase-like flavin-dependent oxidoreductase (luciferase family)
MHHAGWSFADLLHLWQAAEGLGFDGASLYDVFTPSALEVWTALTALSLRTERLTAIPLVLDVGYRHPSTLAKMAATLDLLTHGNRLILGLGYGGNADAHRSYGFSWPERVSQRVERLEEYVGILRGLWSGENTSAMGHWYTLHNAAPFPVATPDGPPILVASRGKQFGLPGVARTADLCNVSFDLGPDEWLEYRQVISSNSGGRRVGLTHNATVVIGRTRQEADATFQAFAQSRRLTMEQARHGLAHALVGTPEDILEALNGYKQKGVELDWIFLLFNDLPETASMRLFAEEVLPAYRASS